MVRAFTKDLFNIDEMTVDKQDIRELFPIRDIEENFAHGIILSLMAYVLSEYSV